VKSKLDKLKRIERLQKRMHDLSVWKLTHMAHEREKLAQAHSEMITALGDGLLSFGGAASAATRRIRAIEVEMKDAEAAETAQARDALEQGLRSRAAERAVQSTSARHRSEARNKSLAELIEQSLQASLSGSRKT
jgi:membrane-associated HD superfamily phosphohydrolase